MHGLRRYVEIGGEEPALDLEKELDALMPPADVGAAAPMPSHVSYAEHDVPDQD
jgi:hypothetical protein